MSDRMIGDIKLSNYAVKKMEREKASILGRVGHSGAGDQADPRSNPAPNYIGEKREKARDGH
ncbi:hypothetical protein HPQ64_09385 [Rhizobiales bacterium]|uniref:hypothetical protein n=1 Tax=Hongsoonwoonella zoysiae TaxID=2821844 RepID=UPI00155F9FCE|nr:hypothetical protein [Hongsoonwoonella zoysiae]NRG17900.1 hypothetical protein [Hongsoonwoonella zoysiae]